MDSSESPNNKKEKEEDKSCSSQLPPESSNFIGNQDSSPPKNSIDNENDIRNIIGEHDFKKDPHISIETAIRRGRLQYLEASSDVVGSDDDSSTPFPEETISMINLNNILPVQNFDSTTIEPLASSSSSSYLANEPTEPLASLNDLDNTLLGDSELNPTPTVIEDGDEFDHVDFTNLLETYMGTTLTEQNCLIRNPSALERLCDDHFPSSKPRPQRPPDVVLTNRPHRLGLAPKLVPFGESTSPVQAQMEQNRKKAQQGCGCEKSRCLKAVCSCFKAKIACTIKCRCLDCDNSYGRKPHRKKGGNNAKKKPQVEKPWKI